jgi:hypothetical protein
VRLGAKAILNLTPDQREALSRDDEACAVLMVISHLLHARDAAGEHGPVPITEGWMLSLARRLGVPLGRNASRRGMKHIASLGVIAPAGVYRQGYRIATPGGHKVPMWSIQVPVWIRTTYLGHAFRTGGRDRRPCGPASVATWRSVKSKPWWEHGVFGNPDGLPPVGLSPSLRKRWRPRRDRWPREWDV